MNDESQDSVPKNKGGVTPRSVLFGLAFVPVSVYLVVQWETVWTTQYPTSMGIFFNAIFCLFLITAFNFSLKKLVPKKTLSQGELLTIYTVLMMATSVSGHEYIWLSWHCPLVCDSGERMGVAILERYDSASNFL